VLLVNDKIQAAAGGSDPEWEKMAGKISCHFRKSFFIGARGSRQAL